MPLAGALRHVTADIHLTIRPQPEREINANPARNAPKRQFVMVLKESEPGGVLLVFQFERVGLPGSVGRADSTSTRTSSCGVIEGFPTEPALMLYPSAS